MKTIFLTDYAWPDIEMEKALVRDAGFRLVSGPAAALPADAITALARQYRPEGIMTCWAEVNAQAIAACPNLEIVARIGVGLDNINRKAAAACGAVVTNVPDYCVEEVSDHAVAGVLGWARGIVPLDRMVKAGTWNPAGAVLHRVADLTIGIIGFGRIGRRTAEKLAPYGCHIIIPNDRPIDTLPPAIVARPLNDLLSEANVVILHLPLTDETKYLMNAERFALMRSGALIVNVSRGAIIENQALLAALAQGSLGAAMLDVIEGEPSPPVEITGHPRTVVTPHVAFSSTASILELRRRATDEVIRVLRGEAAHCACPPP